MLGQRGLKPLNWCKDLLALRHTKRTLIFIEMIKLLLFEDHELLRESLSRLIGAIPDMDLLGAYPDCLSGAQWCAKFRPDVVLMDIDLPGMNGIEGARQIKEAVPETDILMLTVFDDEERVFEAMRAGATGYLLKKTAPMEIIESIRQVKAGGAPMSPSVARKLVLFFNQQTVRAKAKDDPETSLTEREREILSWLVKGHSYKMISDTCQVSINTVRSHLKKVYRKLHVHSMSEAVAKAIRDQLV